MVKIQEFVTQELYKLAEIWTDLNSLCSKGYAQ
jgi:hypothetical protein